MKGENPIEQGSFAQIDARRNDDSMIGAKLGAQEITARLMAVFKNENGVHIESLLCSLGALAGYSCQAAVRAQANARSLDESSLFTIVKTQDGKRYFFGDRINLLLIESKYSVWSIAAAGAQQAGATDLPDLAEIIQHTSAVLGSDAFGRLREFRKNHPGGDLPVNYARALWPKLQPLIAKFCPDPTQWPVLLALCAQQTIVTGKSVLDPSLALRIVMEAAIPVSRVELETGPERQPPPPHTRAPGTPMSERITSSHGGGGPRLNIWMIVAVPVFILVGGAQLSKITDSLSTIFRVASSAPSTKKEQAPRAAPSLAAPPPAPTSISPLPETAATPMREAEYIPDQLTAAALPDVPQRPAADYPSIEQLLRERKLRVATRSDYDKWLRFAARNKIEERKIERAQTYLTLSRMYVVQAPLTFPADLYGAHSAAFIVMPGVPTPAGSPGHSIVMSMSP
jgi:hypothetical protein